MTERKISYEQDKALARGRDTARANQRRRVAEKQRAAAAAAERAEAEAKQAAHERELRGGFEIGDRVTGRDYFWNERRVGVIVEGDLHDGVPVACDDGQLRVLYRRSLEEAS